MNPIQVFFVLLSITLYFVYMNVFGEVMKSDQLQNVTAVFEGAPMTFFSLLFTASLCILVDMIIRRQSWLVNIVLYRTFEEVPTFDSLTKSQRNNEAILKRCDKKRKKLVAKIKKDIKF